MAYLLFMRPPNVGDPERYLLPLVVLVAPLAGLVYEELTSLSWRALWCASAISAMLALLLLAWRQLGHLCAETSCLTWYRSSLILVVLLLAAFAAKQFTLFKGRPWLNYGFLPIFILPFATIALSTTQASGSAGYVAKDGLLQFPESAVLTSFTGNRKYLSFEDRREMLGGEPFPGDHPFLERFYRQRLDGEEAVQELKRLGIGYVYWPNVSPLHPLNHPLMNKSPLFSEFNDRQLFRLVYAVYGPEGRVEIYELR
jgi:hypothetical protein